MFPHRGTEQGEHSKLSCLLTGTWQQAECWQQDSKLQSRWWKQGWETEAAAQSYGSTPPFVPPAQAQPKPTGNPSPSLKLCSPNRTESPSLGHKNLFHSSLMRAGLLLVKAFTLKTHFWKWSCFLCCQSSSENLKLSKKQSHRGICWCPISLAVAFV